MPIDILHDTPAIALEKLKARENALKQIQSIANFGSWEVDLKTNTSQWSDESYKIHGVPAGTPMDLDYFFSHVHPHDLARAKKSLDKALTTGEPTHLQCKVLHTSGNYINIRLSAQVTFDTEGNPSKLIGVTQDITEIIAIKEEAKELSQLIEFSSNEIYIIDHDLHYLYVNQGAQQALGYTQEEMLQMTTRDINPFMSVAELETMKKRLKKSKHILNRTIHKCKDGRLYHVQSYIHTLTYQGKDAYAIFDTDISVTVELEMRQQRQANILEFIHDSIIATDTNGIITNWNHGSTELLGYTKEEILGRSILEVYDKENASPIEELFALLHQQNKLDIEAYMFSKAEQRIICDISLSMLRDENGVVDGYVGYIQDITKQKETQKLVETQTQQLKYQAHHDALTDLPNRALFADRLSQAIIHAKRAHQKFALLFIDLDQFKKINDTLGHDIGDTVLIEASTRLSKSIRQEDTLARLGGDEFCVILKNIKDIKDVSLVAQKIVNVMKEPIKIKQHSLYVTSSVGISIYPDDATQETELVKHADVAMYKAKEEGRNNYQFYASQMSEYVFERVVMESSLRLALKQDELVVYFQPQFRIKTNAIVGMEALVRWQHPSLGLVPPDRFIPIAEESGLIIELDRIVMKKAMQEFTSWYNEGLNPGVLSLNLAMKQLASDDFLTYLTSTMQELQFKAEWLELEVTEGDVMKNPEESIKKLKTIHSLGIEIAIDDFGTGYSSLSYLKKLPLDKLKIDQSFVRDIPTDEDDMAISKAIIALAKSLSLNIIAEGVETQAQRDFLQESECDLIQGYFYSRPLPPQEIHKLLKKT